MYRNGIKAHKAKNKVKTRMIIMQKLCPQTISLEHKVKNLKHTQRHTHTETYIHKETHTLLIMSIVWWILGGERTLGR